VALKSAGEPILRAAPPTGPGWVHATIALRTYRRRLAWAEQDLALHAEDRIYVLDHGWRFIGTRRTPPLYEVVAEGWLPRPRGLPSHGGTPPREPDQRAESAATAPSRLAHSQTSRRPPLSPAAESAQLSHARANHPERRQHIPEVSTRHRRLGRVM
jgi:hypothetical protein